jgi:undecaprenyl-diphosphatase
MSTEIRNTPRRWLTPLGWGTIIILILSVLVFTMALLAYVNNASDFDNMVAKTVSESRNSILTGFMTYVSVMGNTEFLIATNVLVLLFFIIKKDKWSAIRISVVAVTSLALMVTLKTLFQRTRPEDPLITALTSFSFPSGHAFMTVSFYGFMVCWALVGIKHKNKKSLAVAGLLLLLLTIGFSRIYLGAHFATDVLAGWGLGTAWLLCGLLIVDKIMTGKTNARA